MSRPTQNAVPNPEAHGWTEGFDKDYGNSSAESEFHVQEYLGAGALGFVQEVRIVGSNHTLARKRILLPYGNLGRRIRDIIRTEVDTMKDLRHKHIVALIGSYEDRSPKGQRFCSLLMTPVGQDDLNNYLAKFSDETRSMSDRDFQADPRLRWLKTWFGCLTSAISYIHSKGIRHEDIKPSNIVHREGHVYLTDFGSATKFEVGHTTSTESCARTSFMYAPPESVLPSPHDGSIRHGRSSDVFSLGCVFVEMLTVLTRRSTEDLRTFCNTKCEQAGLHTSNTFLYSHVTQYLGEWFETEPLILHIMIMPMLQGERKARPPAKLVLAIVRELECFNVSGSCSCLGREGHTEQQAHQKQHNLPPESITALAAVPCGIGEGPGQGSGSAIPTIYEGSRSYQCALTREALSRLPGHDSFSQIPNSPPFSRFRQGDWDEETGASRIRHRPRDWMRID